MSTVGWMEVRFDQALYFTRNVFILYHIADGTFGCVKLEDRYNKLLVQGCSLLERFTFHLKKM